MTHAYLDDYTQTLKTLVPDGNLPASIPEEKELLKQLKPVEQRSLDRVYESGIFAGLTGQQVAEGAKQCILTGEVELRKGFGMFHQDVKAHEARGDKISLLSVNWSRHFIASCLAASGIEISPEAIISNELGGITEGSPSTGHIASVGDLDVVSSGDKLQWLERMRKHSTTAITTDDQNPVIVYVGDSWTDIEALLAADVGICIRDDSMGSSQKKLAEAFERLDVRCPHISNWWEGDDGNVVWARNYDEIRVVTEMGRV